MTWSHFVFEGWTWHLFFLSLNFLSLGRLAHTPLCLVVHHLVVQGCESTKDAWTLQYFDHPPPAIISPLWWDPLLLEDYAKQRKDYSPTQQTWKSNLRNNELFHVLISRLAWPASLGWKHGGHETPSLLPSLPHTISSNLSNVVSSLSTFVPTSIWPARNLCCHIWSLAVWIYS